MCGKGFNVADYLLRFFDFSVLIEPLISSEDPKDLSLAVQLLGSIHTANDDPSRERLLA